MEKVDMSRQKGIFMYFDYADHFDLLTMEERGELFTALMMGEENPNMSSTARMAFRFIYAQAIRDAQKSMVNSENGRKGGKSKANVSEAEANGSEAEANQSEVKPTKTDTKTDTDTETDTETFLSLPPSAGAAQPDSVGTALKERFSEKTAKEEFERLLLVPGGGGGMMT